MTAELIPAVRQLLDAISAAEAAGWTWADGYAGYAPNWPDTPSSGDLQAAHAAVAVAVDQRNIIEQMALRLHILECATHPDSTGCRLGHHIKARYVLGGLLP